MRVIFSVVSFVLLIGCLSPHKEKARLHHHPRGDSIHSEEKKLKDSQSCKTQHINCRRTLPEHEPLIDTESKEKNISQKNGDGSSPIKTNQNNETTIIREKKFIIIPNDGKTYNFKVIKHHPPKPPKLPQGK